MKPWKSICYWPEDTPGAERSEGLGCFTADYHDTEAAARAVCHKIWRGGMGLQGVIFPVKVEVVSVDTKEVSDE